MKNLKYILLTLAVSAFFVSCKKNKTQDPVTFNGTISDNVQGGALAGATVTLKVQSAASNSVYNTGFTTIGVTTTDASGNYSITATPDKPVTYRIVVSKDIYYGTQQDFDASSSPAGSTTTTNFAISPYGWFRVNIKNTNPFNASDNIIFQNTSEANGCASCCTNMSVNFTGMNVDTFLICQRIAYPTISFSWFITKNGNLTSFSNSISAIIGDTAVYNLTY